MRITVAAAAALTTLAAIPAGASASAPVIPASERGMPVLKGTYQRLNGDPINLARLRGRVVLVVNTASNCGFTDQYEPLEALWRSQRSRGLTVLGVPSQDFAQELPTNAQVKRFCARNFGVSFPMFKISKVTGPRAIPLFRGLASPSWSRPPQWNFNKYLVGRDGRPIAHFGSTTGPGSTSMKNAIEKALAAR
jgi:glutathione peroxidase